ncbi:hypothetical protein EI94DRAFT_1799627 [Lactarius quietus]|nr:hypothetical protein EI94DRAFT_1799627 [Lactarius quietus]
MSHGTSQPINIIAVSREGAPIMSLTITGTHQSHHPPRPSVGCPPTHWHGSTNAFQVITPGVLAVPPNVTVTRGTSTVLTQGSHPPGFVQASGHAYTPRTTPQPSVSVSSGRTPNATFSPPPTTVPSAYIPSPRPHPHPRPRAQPMAVSNPSYCASSSDNQKRADSRGFHYAERTNGGPQVGHARDCADPRVAPGTMPVDADRPGRYLVGPERIAGGGPMARKYLDAAWGVTPGTKKSLGLTD